MLLAWAPAATAKDLIVPLEHATIQDAINRASLGDRVLIEPGEYEENFRVRSQVDVRGRETARVVIRPRSATLPTASVTGVQGVLLANLTFAGGDVAVDIAAATDVTIASIVFDRVLGTALRADATSVADVSNNVFNGNNVAIARATVTTRVTNNIFANNLRTLASSNGDTASVAGVSFNCFSGNADALAGLGTSIQLGDPLFAETDRRDFHLQQGSACIDAGSGTDAVDSSVADAGAYGGGFADPRPFPVPRPDAVLQASGTEIAVSWKPNLSYLVTNSVTPGSYRVHYGLNAPGPPFAGTDAGGGTKPSPIEVGTATSFALTGLAPIVAVPATPQLLDVEPREAAAALTWTAVAGAMSYRVQYGVGAPNERVLDVPGDVTAATVTGLSNGTTYRFTVLARAQATYYIAITVLDNTPSRHESAYSDVASVGLGPIVESASSNELTAIPGPTTPVPDLPDEGCFVATAAYGADWHAEVAILRDFRDGLLVRTSLGRALIRGYYAVGRPLSRHISGHPARQWLARAVLTPFVFASLVAVTPAPAAKATLGALSGALVTLILLRSRLVGRRRACTGCCYVALLCGGGLASTDAAAAEGETPIPRWMVEIKAGDITPHLDSFATFYGDDDAYYIAGSFARSFRSWLEAGGELQYMSETGAGMLSTEGVPGGEVTYTLFPLHLFVNFRAVRQPHQLFVPYAGVGVALAYYKQEIDLQPERTGTSAIDLSVRIGLQLYLNRFDGDTRGGYGTGVVRQTYLFAEIQDFSTKQTGEDLGGKVFTMGFRFTFGKDLTQARARSNDKAAKQ
jgi:hypothetical protein